MALEIASPGRALLGARGRAALSFQKLYLGVALAALTLAACDGPAPPMLRGPDGGVLTFDAAMIDVEPADARASSSDSGVTTPRDSGVRPSEPRCNGVPIGCYGRATRTSCSQVDGCRWDEDCSGVARSCYSRYSSYSCSRQDGCYWSTFSDDCSGSARSCSSYSSSSSCTGQEGCRWDGDCLGVARTCSGYFSSYACNSQPGCSWY
ncbi:MAG: hypothetical protein RLO52_34870 [Sandaracinaceae bacterium]